jgi:protein required for attachment to host cells
MPTTWILAADSARARLFALDGERATLRELEDFVHSAGRQKGRELSADAKARNFVRGRHDRAAASEPHTLPEDVEEQRFARELADRLERGRTANAYDRLCLVAPPRFLGRLREALSKEAHKRVSQSVAKDLVALDAATVYRYIDSGDAARAERAERNPRPGTAAYTRRR